MPEYICTECGSTNQVSSTATHFSCKLCGTRQPIPSQREESPETDLTDIVFRSDLPETRRESELMKQMLVSEEDFVPATPPKKMSDAKKDAIYYRALSKMGGEDIAYYRRAIQELQTIPGWRDSESLIEQCRQKIEQINLELATAAGKEEQRQKKRRMHILIASVCSVLVIASALISLFILLPASNYKKARSFEESGNIVQAYEIFSSLSYKDSAERAKNLFQSYKTQKLKTAEVGDIVYFGSYEQDGNEKNGKEDISWLVLEKKDNKILLLSQYGLDCMPYQSDLYSEAEWANSYARKWLNEDFLQTAFSQKQQSKIAPSLVSPDINPDYPEVVGAETQDKLFLLSIREVKKLLPTDRQRQCLPTSFALSQGAQTSNERFSIGYTTCWYLRTQGMEATDVAYVQYAGTIRSIGASVNSTTASLRPAMRVIID